MSTLVPKGKIFLAQDDEQAFSYKVAPHELTITCFHAYRPAVGAHVSLHVGYEDDSTFPPYRILGELAKFVVASELVKVKVIGDIHHWAVVYFTTAPYHTNGDINQTYLNGSNRFDVHSVNEEILRQLSFTDLDTEGGLRVVHRLGDIDVAFEDEFDDLAEN